MICPKISQKNIKPHFPFSILRFQFSWRRLAASQCGRARPTEGLTKRILEAACRRQWPRIATSFTTWSRTENEFPEAARPPTFPCRVLRKLRGCLGTITQGGGRDCLTLGYDLASPTGTRIFAGFRLAVSAGFRLAAFAFSFVEPQWTQFEKENHLVSRGGCHPSFVRRGALAPPFTIHIFSKTSGRLDRVVIIAKRRTRLKHIPHETYQTAQNAQNARNARFAQKNQNRVRQARILSDSSHPKTASAGWVQRSWWVFVVCRKGDPRRVLLC